MPARSSATWPNGKPDERVLLPPRHHRARPLGRDDDPPGCEDRHPGPPPDCRAAARVRERRDPADHPHLHPAPDRAHPRAVHPGRERHLARDRGLARARLQAGRPRLGDPRLDRGRAHRLVRVGIRRRLGPDRALPAHRSDGTPYRLMDRVLAVAWAVTRWPTPAVRVAVWLFVPRTVLSSG